MFLSEQEFSDVLETVRAYCVGETGPTTESEGYGPLSTPRETRFWQIHATLATAKAGRIPKSPSGD